MSARPRPTPQELQIYSEELLPAIEAMRGFARTLCRGNLTDAEDLIGDLQLKALRYISAYKPGTNARAWLHVCMLRMFYDRYNARQRENIVEYQDFMHGEDVDYDGLIDDAAQIDKVIEAIDDLGEDYAETFRVRYGLANTQAPTGDDGLVLYRTLADQFNVPIGTIMSRLYRGRVRVQSALGVSA